SFPPFFGEPPERFLQNVISVVRVPAAQPPEVLDESAGGTGQLGLQYRKRCVRVTPCGIQCIPERVIQKTHAPSPREPVTDMQPRTRRAARARDQPRLNSDRAVISGIPYVLPRS